jgi:hypothetical protein
MVVELHCVTEDRKVRVKIAAYINSEGKRYENVYDNTFNCRFPRNLRIDGRKFHVPDENVKLNCTPGKSAFYIVSAKNIITLPDTVIEHVWETSTECVICLSADSEIIFTPCGHKCSCLSCGKKLKQCCICRAPIKSMITMEEANTMLAQL